MKKKIKSSSLTQAMWRANLHKRTVNKSFNLNKVSTLFKLKIKNRLHFSTEFDDFYELNT